MPSQQNVQPAQVLVLTYGESYLRERMDRNYWATLNAWRKDPRIVVHDVKQAPVAEEILARRPVVLVDLYATPGHLRFAREHEGRVMQAVGAARRTFLQVEDTHEHSYIGGLETLYAALRRCEAEAICYYRSSMEILARERIRAHYLPHHVDTALHFVRPEVQKQYDVIYYGAGGMRFYAFRRRIEALLRASPLTVRFIVHPGYQTFDPVRCGEALALEINRAWIGICTCSKVRYFLAKYLEVTMNGAVVAGDLPDEEYERVWADDYIPLNEAMPDEAIIATLQRALADKEALKAKARAMQAKLEPFALKHVADHLLGIVAA
jgi:hypothetical protein